MERIVSGQRLVPKLRDIRSSDNSDEGGFELDQTGETETCTSTGSDAQDDMSSLTTMAGDVQMFTKRPWRQNKVKIMENIWWQSQVKMMENLWWQNQVKMMENLRWQNQVKMMENLWWQKEVKMMENQHHNRIPSKADEKNDRDDSGCVCNSENIQSFHH
ncbi:uncharacterized protein LOC124275788 isoform X3 [Haliotis rubra]|uniref:uncharacterized protein LOC124275788 isoform X3 n=1 Tax=Haliotis rubra TaxID=36100 RepID=UPI001EE551F8|nr:uncharacterized protein LOC124275788 isoform X3 [Haliotis rubra]